MLGHKNLFPGLLLCLLLTGLATLLQRAELHLLGQAWLEALVLAILLGLALRTVWTPGPVWRPGIKFSAKTLLEVAVVLLGAAVSLRTVLALGPKLLVGIVATVVLSIFASYFICRALRLAPRLALLVACGNSICGNSAIAAVAPVIGADADDVAASIAFTAVLGVITVLLLPLLVPVLLLSLTQYGVLAGLTVYAVPQVLAATLPIGALSNQIGTVVKLVRVLMLGPVVAVLGLFAARLREEPDVAPPDITAGERPAPGMPPIHHLLPWFIIGFLLLLGARSAGLVPQPILAPMKAIAGLLTTISMAALGLGVDVRSVVVAGPRVISAVTLSLLVLVGISLALIRVLHVP
ncbi:MAG: putative sulfate exporter family transporter [Acidocella sp.]|nr:putative sulfate exporter family transporter [Acidocella sp.]